MSTYFLIIRPMMLLVSLTLGLAQMAWAADRPARGPDQSPPPGQSSMAPGAVEDTLKACMTRIPKDSTIGQRMVAVESCQRDETDRKSLQAVPGGEYASH
jgi:hypothetical protein